MSPYLIGTRPRTCSSVSSRARRSTQCCCADTGPIAGWQGIRTLFTPGGSRICSATLRGSHCVRDDSAVLAAPLTKWPRRQGRAAVATGAPPGTANAEAGTCSPSLDSENGLKLRKTRNQPRRQAHRVGAGLRGAVVWAVGLSILVAGPQMLIVRPLETGSGRRARDPSGTLGTDV
jgi:hypothetical protein